VVPTYDIKASISTYLVPETNAVQFDTDCHVDLNDWSLQDAIFASLVLLIVSACLIAAVIALTMFSPATASFVGSLASLTLFVAIIVLEVTFRKAIRTFDADPTPVGIYVSHGGIFVLLWTADGLMAAATGLAYWARRYEPKPVVLEPEPPFCGLGMGSICGSGC
jgi:hypothetical protein